MCFYFLSNDEMSKLRKKMLTIQSKDENCVRRFEAHAWAPLVTLAQHFTSHKPLGERTARTTGIFSSVFLCPSVNRKIRAIFTPWFSELELGSNPKGFTISSGHCANDSVGP